MIVFILLVINMLVSVSTIYLFAIVYSIMPVKKLRLYFYQKMQNINYYWTGINKFILNTFTSTQWVLQGKDKPDVFIGLSAPNLLKANDIKLMNKDAIVFAMANPVPEIMPDEAKKAGAIGLFGDKDGEKVKVYSVGDYSKEICGGPHVERTGVMGRFRIAKEEASSAGIRRIKAMLE